jgi:hypothetical protein
MSIRPARILFALWLTLPTTGCSYLFMEPPPPQHARLDSFQCRTSKGTPTLDVMYGAAQTIGTIALLAIAADSSGAVQEEATAYAIPTAATAVVAFASGAYGFNAASDCHDALEALAQRQQQARERAIALEEFQLRREHARARREAMESNAPTPPTRAPAPPRVDVAPFDPPSAAPSTPQPNP